MKNSDRILSNEEQAVTWNKKFGEYMQEQSLLPFSRELASIAQAGLAYSKEPFDRERFARLRVMAGELLQLPDYSPDFKWPDELGYPTPKIDVRAAVFKNNTVLLVKEISSKKWTLPGGFADVNFTPSENVERECFEETGYIVKARSITSLIDRERAGYPKSIESYYKIFFLCDLIGGTATTNPNESSEIAFYDIKNLPELDLHRSSQEDILRAYEHFLDPTLPTYFN